MVGATAISRCSNELQSICPTPAPGSSAAGRESAASSVETILAIQALDDAVDAFRGFMARWARRGGGGGAAVPGASGGGGGGGGGRSGGGGGGGGSAGGAAHATVASFLAQHGMAPLAAKFAEAEIESMEDLLFMARSDAGRFEADLKELGVPLGKRRKIESLLQQLLESSGEAGRM